MLLISFLRFIKGYVTFRADNGFPERFVNLCTSRKIPLWDLENHGGTLIARTTINGYKALNGAARKAGMSTRIIKKHGLPFFIGKNRKRKGIAFGLLACIAIVAFLSTMIWSVSVTGNEKYSDDEILETFSENGVSVGKFKRSIDARSACEKAVAQLDGVSWAMVNIKGCFATIEIRESTPVPEIADTEKAVNIVSSADGQIMKCEIFTGTPVVKTGFAVTKGELLVDGVVENVDKTAHFVHSRAYITAKTQRTVKSDSAAKLNSMDKENIKKTVYFFGIKIPFGIISEKNNYFKSESYLQSGKRRLPIGVIRERTARYDGESTLSICQQNLLSAENYNLKTAELFSSCENILEKSVTVSDSDGLSVISGSYVLEEQIGTEQEFYAENQETQ